MKLLPYQKRWITDDSRLKIWLAARQVGKSFAVALEALKLALKEKCTVVLLSASERQSIELMEKVQLHLGAVKRMAKEFAGIDISEREGKAELRLKNDSKIISLPSNPRTVQGYSGHVFLDEFAWHEDPRKIWAVIFPTITRNNYKLRITSTPNGKNFFYELWTNPHGFSTHKTDIYDAVDDGLEVDPEEIRRSLRDELAWRQFYLCEFVEEGSKLLPWDKIIAAETTDPAPDGHLYVGVDVGRVRDLTVIAVMSLVGDVLWLKELVVLERTPFRVQRDKLFEILKNPRVVRCCIDSTGLGMQLAEEAQDAFGSFRVEAVSFSAPVKEELAMTLYRVFDDKRIRIPPDPALREDLHAIERWMTAAGNIRISTERTSTGHADRFWACALAVHAAQTQRISVPKPVSVPRRRDWNWGDYDGKTNYWRTYH